MADSVIDTYITKFRFEVDKTGLAGVRTTLTTLETRLRNMGGMWTSLHSGGRAASNSVVDSMERAAAAVAGFKEQARRVGKSLSNSLDTKTFRKFERRLTSIHELMNRLAAPREDSNLMALNAQLNAIKNTIDGMNRSITSSTQRWNNMKRAAAAAVDSASAGSMLASAAGRWGLGPNAGLVLNNLAGWDVARDAKDRERALARERDEARRARSTSGPMFGIGSMDTRRESTEQFVDRMLSGPSRGNFVYDEKRAKRNAKSQEADDRRREEKREHRRRRNEREADQMRREIHMGYSRDRIGTQTSSGWLGAFGGPAGKELRHAKRWDRAFDGIDSFLTRSGLIWQFMGSMITSIGSDIDRLGGAINQFVEYITAPIQAMSRSFNFIRAARPDISTEGLLTIRSKVLRLAGTTEFRPPQLSEAAVNLARRGRSAETITALLGPVTELALVDRVSVEDSSNMLSLMLERFNLGSDSARRVANALFGVATQTPATMTSLGQGAVHAGNVAASTKLSIESMLAMLGTMQTKGIRPAMAGAAFRTILSRFLAPTTDMVDALYELGIDADEAQLLASRGGFISLLRKLKAAGIKKDVSLYPRLAGKRRVGPFIAMVEGLEMYDKLLGDIQRSQNQNLIHHGADEMTKGLYGSEQLRIAASDALNVVISDAVLTQSKVSHNRWFANWFKSWAEWWEPMGMYGLYDEYITNTDEKIKRAIEAGDYKLVEKLKKMVYLAQDQKKGIKDQLSFWQRTFLPGGTGHSVLGSLPWVGTIASWTGTVVRTFGDFIAFIADFAVLGYILRGNKTFNAIKYFGALIWTIGKFFLQIIGMAALKHPLAAAAAVLIGALYYFWDSIIEFVKSMPSMLWDSLKEIVPWMGIFRRGTNATPGMTSDSGGESSWWDWLTGLLPFNPFNSPAVAGHPVGTLSGEPMGFGGTTDNSDNSHKETHIGEVNNYITSSDPTLAGESVSEAFKNMVEDSDSSIER